MNGEMIQVYIGDYGIYIWKNENETVKEAIKTELNNSIGVFGLKVVDERGK